MKESQFQSQVIKYLKERGAYVLNVAGGTQIPKGTPDLLVCWRGRFIALELKVGKNTTSELQDYHIDCISESGGVAMVIRPENWESFKMELEDMTSV